MTHPTLSTDAAIPHLRWTIQDLEGFPDNGIAVKAMTLYATDSLSSPLLPGFELQLSTVFDE